jgi:hypothetical protein|tara:strand:- start:5263 stop:5379 length:117 start_codon:yes stop_codon:yes gene_type:complete
MGDVAPYFKQFNKVILKPSLKRYLALFSIFAYNNVIFD